jgi:tripartite-type tricarboxylate transporter receptor subunit TctC
VASAVPVKELPHLLAWLKANPQQANFGVPATGSLPHFFALMLGEAAKVPVEVVGYKGSGPLLTDLMGGQIPIAVDTFDTQIAQHEAGKLRVLATSGERRSAMAPGIPTLKELGVNLVGTGWNTLFAPQSMAPATVQRLSQLVQEVMKEADTQHSSPPPTWCLWSAARRRRKKCSRPTARNGRRSCSARASSPDI